MTAISEDVRYMNMVLKYAAKGIGSVEPNPAVGCLITKANQIIGKGWHKKFGQPHAEVNAIEDCKNLGVKPDGATMYVSLEPCCHQGKTPPCTEAIIKAGIKKVVVATTDTSEHARGKGLDILRQAGIEVELGVCRTDAKLLNAAFLKHAATKRPWVILKWAQTIDGKLAWVDADDGKWISNEQSRADVHNIRRISGAIMVGVNTVIADNPMLLPRPAKGKSPLRIVLDNNLRIPLSCRVLNTKGDAMVVATTRAVEEKSDKAERIRKKGAEILTVPEIDGCCYVEAVLDELGRRDIIQILVEGGPSVFSRFIKAGQADEVMVYIAGKMAGQKGNVPIENAMADVPQLVELYHTMVEQLGDNAKMSGLLREI